MADGMADWKVDCSVGLWALLLAALKASLMAAS